MVISFSRCRARRDCHSASNSRIGAGETKINSLTCAKEVVHRWSQETSKLICRRPSESFLVYGRSERRRGRRLQKEYNTVELMTKVAPVTKNFDGAVELRIEEAKVESTIAIEVAKPLSIDEASRTTYSYVQQQGQDTDKREEEGRGSLTSATRRPPTA